MRLIQNDVPKQIELAVQLDLAVPRVDADAEQLKQVLINLVEERRCRPSASRAAASPWPP